MTDICDDSRLVARSRRQRRKQDYGATTAPPPPPQPVLPPYRPHPRFISTCRISTATVMENSGRLPRARLAAEEVAQTTSIGRVGNILKRRWWWCCAVRLQQLQLRQRRISCCAPLMENRRAMVLDGRVLYTRQQVEWSSLRDVTSRHAAAKKQHGYSSWITSSLDAHLQSESGEIVRFFDHRWSVEERYMNQDYSIWIIMHYWSTSMDELIRAIV